MIPDFLHLNADFRRYAALNDDDRIQRIRADTYIAYGRCEKARLHMEDLFIYPKRDRMPCLVLSGAPGMGKTKILTTFLQDHPRTFDGEAGRSNIPVVMFQMPTEPDERSVYSMILDVVQAPHSINATVASMRSVVIRVLKDVGTKILMIDEFQAMLTGSPTQQKVFFGSLRFLHNELRIPLICAGTEEADMALTRNAHLDARFDRIELIRWDDDKDFKQLLFMLGAILPLRRPSKLDAPAVRKQILDMTDGVTARIFRLIEVAAVEAIRKGVECLDLESFHDEDLLQPLVSKKYARNIRPTL